MAWPKVSVVTPSYNMAEFLERTIRSVVCQTYAEIEYIVCDSCSTDRTGVILQRYAPAIDRLIVEKDRGQADALNRAFRLATGEIFAYLNADDCFASEHTIARVVRCFADNPDADVLVGDRYTMNRRGEFVQRYPSRPFDPHLLRRADFVPQEATFWRRRIYEAAGGYVDDSFECAMDYELWLRFLAAGAAFVTVPEVWGLFRLYDEQKTSSKWPLVLREVARLHDAHLGHRLTEAEIFDFHREYLFGTHPTTYPTSFEAAHKLWSDVQAFMTKNLKGKPVDGWTTATPINWERLDRLRWSKTDRAACGRRAAAAA